MTKSATQESPDQRTREKRLLDLARFQQQQMADHVAAMAAACRRGTDGRKLVVFFYGCLFEFAPLPNGAPNQMGPRKDY